mmetsp:Transcript_33365/g.54126  ORF Transcript_33365/g.54126 Transcript_33365/m.54126 type:complete len:379 (+) Transcript_33365:231-1367(+)
MDSTAIYRRSNSLISTGSSTSSKSLVPPSSVWSSIKTGVNFILTRKPSRAEPLPEILQKRLTSPRPPSSLAFPLFSVRRNLSSSPSGALSPSAQQLHGMIESISRVGWYAIAALELLLSASERGGEELHLQQIHELGLDYIDRWLPQRSCTQTARILAYLLGSAADSFFRRRSWKMVIPLHQQADTLGNLFAEWNAEFTAGVPSDIGFAVSILICDLSSAGRKRGKCPFCNKCGNRMRPLNFSHSVTVVAFDKTYRICQSFAHQMTLADWFSGSSPYAPVLVYSQLLEWCSKLSDFCHASYWDQSVTKLYNDIAGVNLSRREGSDMGVQEFQYPGLVFCSSSFKLTDVKAKFDKLAAFGQKVARTDGLLSQRTARTSL